MTDNNKDWFLRAPKDGMTKADYWEAQADMWHQNYKEATNEIKWLRWALRKIRGGLGDPSRNNMLPHEIAQDALDGKW